ncbi:MAG: hypothetical protein WDA71_05810 [Actinomycetota bacterium]
MKPTLESIKAAVEAGGGIKAFNMGVLRDAYGAGKLGVHVRRSISEALAGAGLAHLPGDLPAYQDDMVRVYKLGTPVAEIIDAVLRSSESGDARLREAAAGEDAAILKKIRDLVCG